MHIAASGYYGMGNFGDDLFLHTLRQVFHEHHVYPWNSRLDPRQADAFIIGGGDLITPYSFNSYYFPPQLKGQPTWVYGVGIVDAYPEHTWPEEQVSAYREMISQAKRAVFRDERSSAIAKRAGFHRNVETAPDMVFGYRQPDIPVKRFSKRPTIGVVVFSYESFPMDNMTKLLGHLVAVGYHAVLIPVIHHPGNAYSDYNTCLRLQQKVRELTPGASIETLPFLMDIELTYSFIQSMDYLISFKLHPSLAALRGGKPVLALSTMGKVHSLLSSFHLGQYFTDYRQPLDVLVDKTESFLKYGPGHVQQMMPLIRAAEKKSTASLLDLKDHIEEHNRW
ncbi:polysaccharide pyruvyl transferase family protein [Paenibacillus lautus]|uniref:polysaccharide pyruvyl transferase family protein n=1 Tax=Paenibacillus lautus TaxID=1401 RepID=UPI003D9A5149